MVKCPLAYCVRSTLACLVLGLGCVAEAATWTLLTAGSATGAWNTSGNWTGGVPNATGATADFSTLNISANSTVTLASPVTVGSLTFADATASTHAWTLTGSTLTLAASSGTPALTVTNQTATLASILSGTAGFAKSGAGTLTLTGGASNALTGALTVNAGTLKITDGYSHAGLSGPITVASGATFQFSQNFIGANPLPNALTLSGTGYTGAAFGALHLFGNVTASGPVTLAGDTTITHDFNNATISNTISGAGKNLQLTTLTAGQPGLVISGSIQTGTGALAVTGAANTTGSGSVTTYSVKLSGANTFTGGVTIHNGTLLLAGTGALNATPGSENTVTFGAGTTTGNLTLGGNSVVVANLVNDASVLTL